MVNIVVGVPPADKYTKGNDKVLNVAQVAREILDFVEDHLGDKVGLSERNVHKRVTEALQLLEDLKSGSVRN